ARFIRAFNQVESELSRIATQPSMSIRPTFLATLATSMKKNAAVRSFERDLKEYAELRNAIVHDGTGLPLAEPHADVVARLEYIYQQLSAPPRLTKYNRVDCCGP